MIERTIKDIEAQAPDKRAQFEQERLETENTRKTNQDYADMIGELNTKLEYHTHESQKELMQSDYKKEYPEKRVM